MTRTRAFIGLVITALATAGLVAIPTAPAFAQQTNVSGTVAPSWQTNSTVWALATANNVVYVGGDFTSVRPPGAAAGTNQTARNRLAAFNATTGALVTSFNHNVNGSIRALATSPDGTTLYAGGDFTTVDGISRSRLAAFRLSDGSLMSWAPNPGGTVHAIYPTAQTVYLGGSFGRIGSVARKYIAAVNASTGALRTGFAPVLDSVVYALGGTAAGDRIYAGGAFKSVNGDPTWHAAVALDPTTAAVLPFSAISAIPPESASCISYTKSIRNDATTVYFGNEGTGWGCFDGTMAVNSDGSLKWQSQCLGGTLAIEVVGNQLYVGSHMHDCQFDQGTDPDAFPEVGWAKGLSRHLSNRSTLDGKIGAWSPNTNGGTGGGLGPRVMATDGSQLFVGGEFTTVNGKTQQGFARFSSTTPSSVPARPAGPRAVVRPDGKVSVFVQTPLDLDDSDLTVRFYRDSGTTPFATKTVHALFWRDPIVGVEDNGLVLGSAHTYTADVIEVNGANVSQRSPASNRVTVATSAGAYSDAVNANDPSFFWRLGEGAGSKIASDSASHLLAGEVKGTTTFGAAGAIPGDSAATFDGSTSNVVTPLAVPGPTTYSVEAWFKTTTTSGGKIIGFGNNHTGWDFSGNTSLSNSYDRQVYMTNDGRLIFGVYVNGFSTVNTPGTFNDGQWHHVVGTQGSTGMSLFVDGARQGRNGQTASQDYNGYWRVGGDSLNYWPDQPSSHFFAGQIDDVAVYPTVLSSASVVAHYVASGRTAPEGTQPPTDTYGMAVYGDSPLDFWRLDETSGTAAKDSSGNEDNAIYTGGVAQGRASGIGAFGTSAGFDGINGNVVSSNPTVVNGPFSTELWFRTSSTSGGKLIGFGNEQYELSGNYDKHVYLSTDGRLVFGVWNNQFDFVNSDPGLNDGQWHHMVATQSADGMRLYVDDHLVGQNAITTNQSYQGYWRVGGDRFGGWPYSGSAPYINADIDDVAIYGTALTADQVDAHYRATGRTGPDTVAPQASITSPSDGAAIDIGTVPVTVDATDAVGVTLVEVSVDGTPVGIDTTAPYSVDWNAPAGPHTIVATARDAAGNVGTSSAVAVTATAPDTTPPQTEITSPADGVTVYGATTVTATGTDDRAVKSVTLKVDGTTADTDTSAPYSFTWNATVEGAHVLTTVAEDVAGNTGTSAAVNVTVPADTTAPTAPTGLATSDVTKTSVTLSWLAATDDRGVAGYRVVRNGQVLPGTITALTTTQSGLTANTNYTYAVQAVDAAGNVSPNSDSVTVKTLADTALLFSDDWARADSNSWGPNWAVSSSAGTARTSSGAGDLQFTDVAGAFARANLTAVAAKADTELLVSYRWNQTSAQANMNIYLRGSGGWQNAYRPRTGVGLGLSSTSGTVNVQKNVGGTVTFLRSDTGAQQVTTAKQWLRLRASGTTLQYRIWTDGQVEPSTWTASVSGLDVTSAGQLFIALPRGSTNVGTKTVTFDDLTLTDLNP